MAKASRCLLHITRILPRLFGCCSLFKRWNNWRMFHAIDNDVRLQRLDTSYCYTVVLMLSHLASGRKVEYPRPGPLRTDPEGWSCACRIITIPFGERDKRATGESMQSTSQRDDFYEHFLAVTSQSVGQSRQTRPYAFFTFPMNSMAWGSSRRHQQELHCPTR